MAANNICGQCGEPFEPEAVFCQQCGWRIPDYMNVTGTQSISAPQQSQQPFQPVQQVNVPNSQNYQNAQGMQFQNISQSSINNPISQQGPIPYNYPGPANNVQYTAKKPLNPLIIGIAGILGVIIVVGGAYLITKGPSKNQNAQGNQSAMGSKTPAAKANSNAASGVNNPQGKKDISSNQNSAAQGVKQQVNPDELKGNWKGSLTFVDMQGFEGSGDEEDVKKLMNKPQDVKMNIDARPDGTGKVSFLLSNNGQEASESPWLDYKYSNGQIDIRTNSPDVQLQITGSPSKDNSGLSIKGEWDIIVKSLDGKTAKVKANWQVDQVSKETAKLASDNASDSGKKEIVIQPDNPNMISGGAEKQIDPTSGVAPFMVKGVTMIPIRGIIEEMGGTVDWNDTEKKVTINYNTNTIEMWINKTDVYVNGLQTKTEVAPQIIKGRTVLPVKFIAENLDCEVVWDAVTRNIKITY